MIRVVKKGSIPKCLRFYVGRPAALGNPFVIGKDGTRAEVIAKYRQWLAQKIAEKDPKVCAELNRLFLIAKAGDLELECFCAPKRCHADVIAEVLNLKLLELS